MKKITLLVFLCSFCTTWAQDAWTQMNAFPEATRLHGSFVTDDYAYVLKNNLPGSLEIYRYNVAQDSWTQMNPFPMSSVVQPYGFTYNGDGYLLTRNELADSAVIWKYDEPSDTWNVVTTENFGGFGLYDFDGSVFVQGDKAYVLTSASQSNFRSYDFITDTWEVLTNYPEESAYATRSLSVGDKSYVLFWWDMGAGFRTPQLYEYDIQNDEWIERPEYPPFFLAFPLATFVLDDYIYAGVEYLVPEFHRYNTLDNTWEEIENYGQHGSIGASFSFQGSGYVVGGIAEDLDDQGTYLLDEVWRLEPEFLSVSENDRLAIQIAPNPAKNHLEILGLTGEVNYEIRNVNGQLLDIGITENKRIITERLVSGLYFLSIHSGNKTSVIKLIKD